MINRRTFVAAAGAAALPIGASSQGSPRQWQSGTLEIHHIATGRGDATLIVSPSGRLALIDAGAVIRDDPALIRPLPDGSRSPGGWIADYVRQQMRVTGASGLDTVTLSHFHDDHIAGLPDVAAAVPVAAILDRSWPNYRQPFEGLAVEAYRGFANRWAQSGRPISRLAVGTTGQVLADERGVGAWFTVRTVAASGVIWTGQGADQRTVFPDHAALAEAERPNENANSAAFLISYGAFRYFHGGDLTDWADAGTRPWMNALTPAAQACGPVDVALAPHHGMFDSLSGETIRALQPKAWIISAWHAAHPSPDALERMLHTRLYGAERAIFMTALHPAAELAMRRLTSRLHPIRGHVVVRVSPDGGYSVSVDQVVS